MCASGPWMTAEDVMGYLRLPSRNIVYQMVREGQIPCYRLGERRLRFKRSDLDDLLEQNRSTTLEDLDKMLGDACLPERR